MERNRIKDAQGILDNFSFGYLDQPEIEVRLFNKSLN